MEPTQNSLKRSGAAQGPTTTVINPKVPPAASVPSMPSQIDTEVPRRPPPKTITTTPAIAPNRRRFRRGGGSPSTGWTLSSRSSLNEYPPPPAPRYVTLNAFVARCLVYTSPPGSLFTGVRGRGILRSSPRGVYLGGLRSSGVSGFRCHQPHTFLASLTASINDSTASNIDRANAATQHLNRNCPTTRIRPPLPTVPMCQRDYT